MDSKELYTEMILDLFKNPINRGTLDNHNLHAEGGNPICGDEVIFQIRISNNTIEDIKFDGHGCAISIAAESILTEMVKGKSIQEIKNLTQEDVFKKLGNIVETRIKCATLGLHVLKKAVEKYEESSEDKVVIKGIII